LHLVGILFPHIAVKRLREHRIPRRVPRIHGCVVLDTSFDVPYLTRNISVLRHVSVGVGVAPQTLNMGLIKHLLNVGMSSVRGSRRPLRAAAVVYERSRQSPWMFYPDAT